MIKLVMPMKRKPGMSVEAFRAYYETRHKLIGEKYLAGDEERLFDTRYRRPYLVNECESDMRASP